MNCPLNMVFDNCTLFFRVSISIEDGAKAISEKQALIAIHNSAFIIQNFQFPSLARRNFG
jgi:hypothetical protein